jgi:hypothetical protein
VAHERRNIARILQTVVEVAELLSVDRLVRVVLDYNAMPIRN